MVVSRDLLALVRARRTVAPGGTGWSGAPHGEVMDERCDDAHVSGFVLRNGRPRVHGFRALYHTARSISVHDGGARGGLDRTAICHGQGRPAYRRRCGD